MAPSGSLVHNPKREAIYDQDQIQESIDNNKKKPLWHVKCEYLFKIAQMSIHYRTY